MNVYDAIMATAVLFEKRPLLYDFQAIEVPSCGSAGCLIGWIAHFQGCKSNNVHGSVCLEVLGVDHNEFYNRVEAIVSSENLWCEKAGWTRSAALASKILRAYAKIYHAPAKRTDSELVAALMTRVMGERIPEDA